MSAGVQGWYSDYFASRFSKKSRLLPARLKSRRVSILGEAQPLSDSTVTVFGAALVIVGGLAVGFLGPLAIIAVPIGGIYAYLVLQYPAIGGFAIAALVPITSGLTRGFPVPGLRISEVLVGLTAILVLVPAARHKTNRWNAVDWTAFLYSIAMILFAVGHLLAAEAPIEMRVMAPMLLPLQFFLIYRVVRMSLSMRRQRNLAIALMLLASLAVDALAILQQLNIGPARELVLRLTSAEALESYGYSFFARATGPFQHWHPLAGYLVVIILVTIALLLDQAQEVLARKWLWLVLVGAVAALGLSVTFVALFGVVVGAIYLGVRADRVRDTIAATVAGGVVGGLLFGPYFASRLESQYSTATGGSRNTWVPQTVSYRYEVWAEQYIPSMSGHWVAGFGPTLPPETLWTHTESVYLNLALRGGIPLLALFGASMFAIHAVLKRVETDVMRRPLARAGIALVGVLWVMHFLFPYFTSSGMPQPFWVLIGVCFAGIGLSPWKDSQNDPLAGRMTK